MLSLPKTANGWPHDWALSAFTSPVVASPLVSPVRHFLARIEKLLGPAIAKVLQDPLAATYLGDALPAAQPRRAYYPRIIRTPLSALFEAEA